jgi:hypothetical protein
VSVGEKYVALPSIEREAGVCGEGERVERRGAVRIQPLGALA